MPCPNCKKEMKNKSYSSFYGGFVDPGDYGDTHTVEKFYCQACKITYEQSNWQLPSTLPAATAKQHRAVAFINRQLGTDFEAILKYPTIKFISENLARATKKHEYYKEHKFDFGFDESDVLACGLTEDHY